MRDPGYYFIKTDADQSEWEIAQWDAGYWWIVGSPSHYNDGVFDVIGSKVTMPE